MTQINKTARSRDEKIAELRDQPEISVLIVGGGVNGIGVFRDLAMQGVDVLLVEMNDYSSGASAGSSHMVHGGLRYLENGEFRLVREALTERNRLLQNAAHYVKPLPTTIPIFNWFSGMFNAPLKFVNLRDKPSARGALVIKIGLTFYDLFTRGQQTLPRHKFTSKQKSLEQRPALNPDIINTATYYDAWMPYPERICLELILDAEAESTKAKALNYVKAVGAAGDFVTLRDEVSGEEFSVKPKIVVNAAGPWIDFANRSLNRETRFIGGTKGSHIVVDHPELHEATRGHELFFENKDGRICLIFPLLDKVLVGTTDIRIDDPSDAVCTDEEIDYMLELVHHVFPKITVDRSQIVFHFSGVRPLPSSEASTTGQISRDHSIRTIEADDDIRFPVLSLVGGKWTTFRAFAEQTTDQILERLGRQRAASTASTPIGGGLHFPRTDAERAKWLDEHGKHTTVERDRWEILLDRYGTRAATIAEFMSAGDDAPLAHKADYTRREIVYLAENEQIAHLDDLLLRRSLLGMLGFVNAALLEEIAGILAETLGWTETQKMAEIERAARILAENHGVEIEIGVR